MLFLFDLAIIVISIIMVGVIFITGLFKYFSKPERSDIVYLFIIALVLVALWRGLAGVEGRYVYYLKFIGVLP